jgi:hypothetical protein
MLSGDVGGLLSDVGEIRDLDGTYYDDSPAPGSEVHFTSIDAGDFSWSGTEQIRLHRYTDRFVIKLASGANFATVTEALTRDGAPLERYAVSHALDSTRHIFSRDLSSGEARDVDLSAVRDVPGVELAVPLFKMGELGSWVAITDEVIVALKPGIDPAEFFGEEFETYRRISGAADQFVGTLASGGGVEALSVANRLHTDTDVRWASPNAHRDFRRASTPNDTLFSDQWHLHNTAQFGATSDADTDAPDAWDTTTGSSASGAYWWDGDFDFDGEINQDDLTLIANGFGKGVGNPL